jgi:diguanylate cyclase (GGDEF)-like protein
VDRETNFRLGEGVIGGVAKMVQSVLMGDVGKGRRKVQYLDGGGRVVSLMVVPVEEGNVVRGVLTADHGEPDRFTRSEQEIFEGFATEVSLLMENIRVSFLRDRRSSNMEIIGTISEELSRSLKIEDMFESLLDNIQKVIPYAQCAVFLLDRERKKVVVRAQRGFNFDKEKEVSFPMSKGLVGWIVSHKQALIFSDRKKMEIIPGYTGREKMRSVMGLPLYSPGEEPKDSTGEEPNNSRKKEPEKKLLGVIFFASPVKGTFTTHQLETMRLLMGQVGAQVSNAFLHSQVEKMAVTDGLTGLYNHRHFQERLSHELNVAARHGHPFGDVVLKGVSSQLSQVVRGIDLVARYGGEEFAIVLVSTKRKGINQMAERILKVIRALSFDYEGKEVKVTVSVGSAMFFEDGETKEDLIRCADQALYNSKNKGRNRHTSWEDLAG